MNFLNFVILTLLQLYTSVLLLRVWMQCVRADFYNPFSQFIVKITQPIVRPLRSIIPSIGPIDTASVLLAYVLILLGIIIPSYLSGTSIPFSLMFPFAFIELLTAAGKMIFWLIIIRAILSWVSQGRNPIDHLLFQLTEPLMAPIRRVIPAMGGLDFSAMIVILVLYALNYLRVDVLQWLLSVTLY
ncbi:YggT family protein [Proteus cibarius]|uniref:YggT family protein n=1 Tax=Proteus terrae subsp. cibarius TaxID=626774 RepID=A0A8I0WQW1_9GAMM|nr:MULTISPECIES: YggT family protein [Proteus]KLU19844.1 membrane protein [Proteus mirabilis]QHP75580.1 YggT family protein [Proteus vulgaris]MBG2913648.1 YggT family protein [Proteus terrae subsp. cibarius]MBG3089321.1 YggT family protein [Proteus terrae subsp. cibarius]MBG6037439.1 YggT family protein [Proteus terrae subsp. cibarius]